MRQKIWLCFILVTQQHKANNKVAKLINERKKTTTKLYYKEEHRQTWQKLHLIYSNKLETPELSTSLGQP